MLKRLLIVSLAMGLWSASDNARAAETLDLRSDNVVLVWQNINEILLVLSANIAMDDEWIEGLRNLQPDEGATDFNVEMSAFHEKLNKLLSSSGLDNLPQATPPETISEQYVSSGTMLDHLVYYLIDSDSLATVAIYYGGEAPQDSSTGDIVAQINLANQRIDAFFEENGL